MAHCYNRVMRHLVLFAAALSACGGSEADSSDTASDAHRGGTLVDGAPYGALADGRALACCSVAVDGVGGGTWIVGTSDDGKCIFWVDTKPVGRRCLDINGCPVIEGAGGKCRP